MREVVSIEHRGVSAPSNVEAMLNPSTGSTPLLGGLLSTAALLTSGCAATRHESDVTSPAATAPQGTGGSPLKSPSPDGEAPLLSGSFSTGLRNNYVLYGFIFGEGPVQQTAANVDINRGPLAGASLFTWSNYDYGRSRDGNGMTEVDIGASYPLLRQIQGNSTIEARAGLEHWLYPSRLVPADPFVASLALTYTHTAGLSGALTAQHLFARGELPNGLYLELDLAQRIPLPNFDGLSLKATLGHLDDLFGASGSFVTPALGLEIPLNRSTTVRGDAGYQLTNGLEDAFTAGIEMSIRF